MVNEGPGRLTRALSRKVFLQKKRSDMSQMSNGQQAITLPKFVTDIVNNFQTKEAELERFKQNEEKIYEEED